MWVNQSICSQVRMMILRIHSSTRLRCRLLILTEFNCNITKTVWKIRRRERFRYRTIFDLNKINWRWLCWTRSPTRYWKNLAKKFKKLDNLRKCWFDLIDPITRLIFFRRMTKMTFSINFVFRITYWVPVPTFSVLVNVLVKLL